MATKAEWAANQRLMNKALTRMKIDGIDEVKEDGIPGPSTRKLIHDLKFFLGWDADRTKSYTKKFHYAIKYPFSNHYVGGPNVIKRGRQRVRDHNKAYAKHKAEAKSQASTAAGGLATYNGVQVYAGAIKYLDYARAHGWTGRVNSGYRTPEYSEHLCYNMCGAPSCPGRCAGKSTNHAWKQPTRWAMDVSDYVRFGQIMRTCPITPRIFNALGAQDPVHFSPTGR